MNCDLSLVVLFSQGDVGEPCLLLFRQEIGNIDVGDVGCRWLVVYGSPNDILGYDITSFRNLETLAV